jgi:hypothetical protein
VSDLIAKILSAFAISILNSLLARKDLQDATRLRIAQAAEGLAAEARQWKADNPISLDDLPDALKLRGNEIPVRLPGDDTGDP